MTCAGNEAYGVRLCPPAAGPGRSDRALWTPAGGAGLCPEWDTLEAGVGAFAVTWSFVQDVQIARLSDLSSDV